MVKVKQGDIIKINFNPQSGHEQSGYRPALIRSSEVDMRLLAGYT